VPVSFLTEQQRNHYGQPAGTVGKRNSRVGASHPFELRSNVWLMVWHAAQLFRGDAPGTRPT
jgi:hypothetical protein